MRWQSTEGSDRVCMTGTYNRAASPATVPESNFHRQIWLPATALAAALYLMYAPVFLTDYLMNDEWQVIGSHPGIKQSAKEAFFIWGRSLFGIYSSLVYRFVRYDPFRVQIVRFVNFASLVGIALFLLMFLAKKSENVWFSFAVVLLLYSTGSMQEGMAYGLQLISNLQPAIWFSLLAFYVHFCVEHKRLSKPIRLGAVFLLLILAMQSTQTFVFFAMVPLTYLILSDWQNQRRKISEFIALAFLVLLFSSLVYKAGLHYWHANGREGYQLAEGSIATVGQHPFQVLLHAANPLTYWSAFEIFSYPFPFHNIPPSKGPKMAIAVSLMTAWAMLLLGTMLTEARQGKKAQTQQVVEKWLAVFVCLGLNAVFIIVDSPLVTIEHRPHMVFASTGIIIISAAYCLKALAARFPVLCGILPRTAGGLFIAFVALGAQAGTLRGYVDNRMQLINFIRTEAVSKDPASYHDILVVLPKPAAPELRGVWVGHPMQRQWHMTREGGYRYAIAGIGIPPEDKTITFVEEKPATLPQDSVLIDWQKYVSARQHEPF